MIARMPCTIKLLRVSKGRRELHDCDEYARLVDVAKSKPLTYLVVLLGGDKGLRCGEIMALEWKDVDLQKRRLCVARSDWKGHVTATKGGRIRYVPMNVRLAEALTQGRHLRAARVAIGSKGEPLTQKVVQKLPRRAAGRAHVKGVHILRHTFCSHLAMRGAPARAIQELAGTRTWRRRSATCT